MKTIYIAGAITGREISEVKAQFAATEATIRAAVPGAKIINPLKLKHEHDHSWQAYMDVCLHELQQCSHMVVQRGWHSSAGVKAEIKQASEYGIHIAWEQDSSWLQKLAK